MTHQPSDLIQPPSGHEPTSKVAADKVIEKAATIRVRVMKYFVNRGIVGATDLEMYRDLNHIDTPQSSLRARRRELINMDRLSRSNNTRKSLTSNCQAIVWVIPQHLRFQNEVAAQKVRNAALVKSRNE